MRVAVSRSPFYEELQPLAPARVWSERLTIPAHAAKRVARLLVAGRGARVEGADAPVRLGPVHQPCRA